MPGSQSGRSTGQQSTANTGHLPDPFSSPSAPPEMEHVGVIVGFRSLCMGWWKHGPEGGGG
jgi:hypothetical protein